MVIYATDNEKKLIIRALSYYARHAGQPGGVLEQIRKITATLTKEVTPV